jgi:o-succinylbenzoate---CoA ligase
MSKDKLPDGMNADFQPVAESPSRWLQRNAVHFSGSPALVDGQGTSSHAELYGQVLALARLLDGYGISRGTVIAASCRSSRLLMLLTHAAPMLGCALQPMNRDLPWLTAEALLARTGASCLIADAFPEKKGIQFIDAAALVAALERQDRNIETDLPATASNPDEVHLIIATSGSEGEPKAAMFTGRNILAAAAASRERIGLGPEDRWLVCLPLQHIGGLAILHRCAQAGASVISADGFDPTSIGEILHRQTCTHLSVVPAMLARLLESVATPPPMLRRVLVGGAALDPGLAGRALERGWPLCISYGLTEAGSQVATLCHPERDWPGRLVGQPLVGMEVRVDNLTGRIRIRGDAVMAGYANPEREPGAGLSAEGWFETGDLGRMDGEGGLWVLGRADDMLITGGVNVHPREVERLLADCPGIAEVAVTGQQDPVWGERLVVLLAGSAEPAEVEQWCRANLPAYMRPRQFIKVSGLPCNAMGKLDRCALRTLVNTSPEL